MRALRFIAAPVVAWLLGLAPALAEPPQAALRLYVAGDYLAAAAAGEASASPSALLLTSRALMAACFTAPDRSAIDDWLARAEASAEQALSLAPASVEARLQLAVTLGVRARRLSTREAITRNYAGRGRRLIREALALDPDNAQAHALMGGWHLEVLRRGGRAGALLYGARLETGLAEFERARSLAPEDGLIALHYAIALLQLEPERESDRVTALLEEAARRAPRDAFEAYAFAQGRRIQAVLAQQGMRAADAAAGEAFL